MTILVNSSGVRKVKIKMAYRFLNKISLCHLRLDFEKIALSQGFSKSIRHKPLIGIACTPKTYRHRNS